jgi:hypothetical protein
MVSTKQRFVYVATQSPALLQIFDVNNPSAPVLVGSTNLVTGATVGIAVSGRYAYLPIGGAVQIFDVSNPMAPVSVGPTQ